jgi:maltose alpha-D-glucosyltransferase/alpha-amylase
MLTEQERFSHAPELLGAIEYQSGRQEAATLATLQRYVPHQGDAWNLTRDALGSYFERCLALPGAQLAGAEPLLDPAALLQGTLLEKSRGTMPEAFASLVDVYPAQIRLLGQRTAELHRALSEDVADPQFAPEPFNTMHQRSLYESTRTRLKRSLTFLRRQRDSLPERERQTADELLHRQGEFDAVLKRLVSTKIDLLKIRIHGDYHLGQVLFTGKDFIIIDFEGEPGRTLAERRFKYSAMRDVAAMIRSLEYAALSALRTGPVRPSDVVGLEPWARAWSAWMGAVFLNGYLAHAGNGGLVAESDAHINLLLDFYLLDKCLYELDYEFNNRPDWVSIPLFGLAGLLDHTQHGGERSTR